MTTFTPNNNSYSPLTRFKPASMLELLTVSIPIVLSLISSALMIMADRLFLAYYSTDAMNAAFSSTMLIGVLQVSSISLTSIAHVFVGQYNGSGQYHKIGTPVWQMIWCSLFSAPIFIFIGLFGGEYLFHGNPVKDLALEYFNICMCFTFLAPLAAAISSFFIGRGKTQFVFLCTLTGNLVNFLFNWLLIFGIDGIIPAYGVMGAAIATVIGQGTQCTMLFLSFYSKKNRETYGTDNSLFRLPLFKKCIAVGSPSALDRLVNVAGWAVFVHLIGQLGTTPLTVMSITQSMMLFFLFISQGIGRGIGSIGANIVGAKEWSLLPMLVLSGVGLNLILFFIYGFFFLIFPESFASLYLPDHISTSGKEEILSLIVTSCVWLWAAAFIDGLKWVYVGLLTAVGDTRFVMFAGCTSIWIFAIIPSYILVVKWGIPVSYAWACSSAYYAFLTCIYAYRFSREKWKGKLIIEEEAAVRT